MCVLGLTVQVLNIPPMVTVSDLKLFFSYCGFTENIWLQRNDKDRTQMGYVTFRQPYAFRTALLLDVSLTMFMMMVR
uniref:RRM domain-containing protein n=1 Tax=Kalanchoe fedtschenkoi TaxID=63787 RepID=A0A7N0UIL5_KALFE